MKVWIDRFDTGLVDISGTDQRPKLQVGDRVDSRLPGADWCERLAFTPVDGAAPLLPAPQQDRNVRADHHIPRAGRHPTLGGRSSTRRRSGGYGPGRLDQTTRAGVAFDLGGIGRDGGVWLATHAGIFSQTSLRTHPAQI